MNQKLFHVARLPLLLTALISPASSQTSSAVKSLLSQKIGLNQDQIAAVQQGRPFVKSVDPRSSGEIVLFGVIYVNAAPQAYMKRETDLKRVRPGPLYGVITRFSDPPQLSDLQNFGLDSDDIRSLKDCAPGSCKVQIPASETMDEFRKSINWTDPNVNDQVNQFLRKLVLSQLQRYVKDGDRVLNKVYSGKGQQISVTDQFKFLLSYYKVLPQDLPGLNSYILNYPDSNPQNVENSFYWEQMNFGLKPTLRVVHVLAMRGQDPSQPLYVIAEKQLYASHYFETALNLTFLLRGNDDPKQTGFYLVKTMGSEQDPMTGVKGSMTRRLAVGHAVSDLEKSLGSIKDSIEHEK
jgi:hypothetical protein